MHWLKTMLKDQTWSKFRITGSEYPGFLELLLSEYFKQLFQWVIKNLQETKVLSVVTGFVNSLFPNTISSYNWEIQNWIQLYVSTLCKFLFSLERVIEGYIFVFFFHQQGWSNQKENFKKRKSVFSGSKQQLSICSSAILLSPSTCGTPSSPPFDVPSSHDSSASWVCTLDCTPARL